MKPAILTLSIVLILAIQSAFSQSIVVSGGWSKTVSTLTEAGSDYTQSTASPQNQTLISIRDRQVLPVLNLGWEIRINRVDVDWDSRLSLKAVRTGNGTPTNVLSSISAGNQLVEVNVNSQVFFTGNSTYDNIPIQYQISGLSVTIPAKTYSTTIVYTLMD